MKSGVFREDSRPDLANALLIESPSQQQHRQQLLARPRTTSSEYRLRRSASFQASQSCSIKVIGRQVSSPSLGRPQTPTLGSERQLRGQGPGPRSGTPRPHTATHILARSTGSESLAAFRPLPEHWQLKFSHGETSAQSYVSKIENPLIEDTTEKGTPVNEPDPQSTKTRRRKSAKLSRSSSASSAPLAIRSASVSLSNRPSASVVQTSIIKSRPNTAALSQVKTQKFNLELSNPEDSQETSQEDKSLCKNSSPPGESCTEPTVETCKNVINNTEYSVISVGKDASWMPSFSENTSDNVFIDDFTTSSELNREVGNFNANPTDVQHSQTLSPSAKEANPGPVESLPLKIDQYPVYDGSNSSEIPQSGDATCLPQAVSDKSNSEAPLSVDLKTLSQGHQVEETSQACEDSSGLRLTRREETSTTQLLTQSAGKSLDDNISIAASSVVDSESSERSPSVFSDLTPRRVVHSPPADEMRETPTQLSERQGVELVDRASAYKIRYRGSHSAESNGEPRAPRSSITEEIRRQNQLLEERNSEVSRVGQTTDKMRLEPAVPEAVLVRQASGLVPNKGEVCGSPGFSLMQGQLRNTIRRNEHQDSALPPRRTGVMPRSISNDKGRRPLRSLSSPDGGDLTGPKGRIPVRECAGGLCVEGDACGTESSGSAVSSTAPSPALASVSRVSVQDSSLLTTAVNRVISESKARVSLAFLKDKPGDLSTGFRHRLSAAPDKTNSTATTANDRPSSSVTPRAGGAPYLCVQNAISPRPGRQASPGNTPRYIYVGFEVEESGSNLPETQKDSSPQPR